MGQPGCGGVAGIAPGRSIYFLWGIPFYTLVPVFRVYNKDVKTTKKNSSHFDRFFPPFVCYIDREYEI